MFRSRLWQAGPNLSVAIGGSRAVLKWVVKRSETPEPPLDICVAVPYAADTFQRLMIRKCAELRDPNESLKRRLTA